MRTTNIRVPECRSSPVLIVDKQVKGKKKFLSGSFFNQKGNQSDDDKEALAERKELRPPDSQIFQQQKRKKRRADGDRRAVPAASVDEKVLTMIGWCSSIFTYLTIIFEIWKKKQTRKKEEEEERESAASRCWPPVLNTYARTHREPEKSRYRDWKSCRSSSKNAQMECLPSPLASATRAQKKNLLVLFLIISIFFFAFIFYLFTTQETRGSERSLSSAD